VPGSQVDVEVREGEIVLRRVKTAMDVAGSLSKYGKNAEGMSWGEMREYAMRVMGEEYARKWGLPRKRPPRRKVLSSATTDPSLEESSHADRPCAQDDDQRRQAG